ncbi:MAG TPA: hypothetical protein VKS01_00830, partial [Bryobacteraceae bacterium]|nr:hypothetical protein [Bryobacteraceae bacterium]
QLNRTSDGTHLWAQTFDSAGQSLLDIQDEIARSITYYVRSRVGDAQSLDVAMRQGRVHLSRDTADAYLRGLAEASKFTPRSTVLALALFDRVVADAPAFGDGYGARGMVHTQLADSSAGDPRKESTLAVADLRQALELHTRFPAHVLVNLAYLEYRMDWDWPRAEAHIKESLAQADTAYAHRIYGWGLITRGRIPEGEEQFRKMVELDPLNVINRAGMTEALLEASRFGPASEQASEVMRLNPRWWLASAVSAQVDIYDKKPMEALPILEKIGGADRNAASVQLGYAAADAELKRNQDAVDILNKLEAGAAGVPPIQYYVGVVYGLLGESSRLFEYLDKSADEREYEVLYTRIDPLLSRWQSDARMIQLERRLGLADKE